MRALLDLALEHRMRVPELGSHSAQHQARNSGADYEHHEQNEGLVKPRPRERPATDRRPPDRESRENKRSRRRVARITTQRRPDKRSNRQKGEGGGVNRLCDQRTEGY